MQASVKEDRNLYIGGSDIPSIMGISHFKTRWELLQEKAGLITNDFEGNEYTEYGNEMEPKIRDYFNNIVEDKYEEGKYIDGDIRCHTDGINSKSVLEIKTTSRKFDTVMDYKDYLVQLLFYMYNTGRNYGTLAVYNRPKNFDTNFEPFNLAEFHIKIEEYADLVEKIKKEVDKFRVDLEKIRQNPFLKEEELFPVDVTKYANEVIALETELQELKEIEEKIKIKKENLKSKKENLKQAMETFGIKKWETPNGTKITLVADGEDKVEIIKELDEGKFRAENLELVQTYELKQAEYLIEKEIIKKGRKGYIKITLPKGE